MIGIYCIRNEVNGKMYYGQTVDYERRKKQHLMCLRGGYHDNEYLQRSWRKYGESAFTISFVESCPVEKLDELEIKYIADNRTLAPSGYNLTSGGEGVRGLKFSPEQITVMREKAKSIWEREGYRDRMREIHRGHRHSAETKAKMSALRRKNPSRIRPIVCVETGIVYPAVSRVTMGGKTLPHSSISEACSRGSRAYGYHWEYIDDR